MNRLVMQSGAALTGLVVANCVPALAAVAPIGVVLCPRLVGLGRPGHTALTFDDGPDPRSTPAVLDSLATLGWRATFFTLGPMVDNAPRLAARIVAEGHELAVHGYRHTSPLIRTHRQITEDLRRTIHTIEDAAGVQPVWYRPPYGHLSLAAWHAASEHGLQTTLWTAWGRDWRSKATPRTILADLARGTLDGGTVLLHDSDCTSSADSWRNTVGALPLLAAYLHDRQLEVGPLNEHFRKRGERRRELAREPSSPAS